MTKRMLIDATQTEEIRVVMTSGNRVEDFDFEVASRRPLKGNIYLAQVTRVEPSLQAAFVEYGGNRHGFLAFSEIHPDYYRIPMEDREALLAEQPDNSDFAEEDIETEKDDDAHLDSGDGTSDDNIESVTDTNSLTENSKTDEPTSIAKKRQYKIQEVIARRQIMLVQVVKEERGNKGAALTTFLSLAGRYCVLMPNTPRGGGVSRKIISALDRKRLKSVVDGLSVPEGMAVIVRTAGSQRTKTEIKRDYEYLIRLWDEIRESTLVSTAPYLVHEEGNLIKRSIRDLYTRDIDEILVEGDTGYRLAKSFMKTLMPSHARRVQMFSSGGIPLFSRFQIENQLNSLYEPVVQLKSGGYLVLNQTEALVAVDVNSGKSTRERNIEETALKTNLEAAEEVARQLRLRDLAGLVVIDFIDMYESRNQHAIERKMKDVIKSDRARIQLGRISQFGLMELSRQRLRPSVTESSTQPCPHCAGSGLRRSIDSAALQVLRNIEQEGLKQEAKEILIQLTSEVGFYVLNQKRDTLDAMEQRYAFKIILEPNDKFLGAEHKIERTIKKTEEDKVKDIIEITETAREEFGHSNDEATEIEVTKAEVTESSTPKPRQRRRRINKRKNIIATEDNISEEQDIVSPENSNDSLQKNDIDEDDSTRRRRRRGKRGGRRRTRKITNTETSQQEGHEDSSQSSPVESAEILISSENIENESEIDIDSARNLSTSSATKDAKPDSKPKRRPRKKIDKPKSVEKDTAKPARKRRKSASEDATNPKLINENKKSTGSIQDGLTPEEPANSAAEKVTPRRGWWNRLIQ